MSLIFVLNVQIIKLFLTNLIFSLNPSFSLKFKCMIIKTIGIGKWAFGYLEERVFKLINQIILFRYSEGIFSGHIRAHTFILTHNTANCTLFNKLYYVQEFLFFAEILRHECKNNRNWLMSFWLLGRTTSKTVFSNSLTKFYCFNIQKGFFRHTREL